MQLRMEFLTNVKPRKGVPKYTASELLLNAQTML